MPRPPRLELAGVPLHVIQRGNNRGACFFGDADRRYYLRCLGESAARRGCEIHAYVLMSNHVHMLATPLEAGAMGATLQDMGRRYVRVVNKVHARTGTLWEGRFKSSLVDTERYFLTCHRYIELNPVRAGLAKNPAEYPWSSHSYYALGKADRLLTEHPVHAALGPTTLERQTAFRSIFTHQINEATLAEIRDAANANAALGSREFLEQLAARLGRPVRMPRRGRPSGNADRTLTIEGQEKLL